MPEGPHRFHVSATVLIVSPGDVLPSEGEPPGINFEIDYYGGPRLIRDKQDINLGGFDQSQFPWVGGPRHEIVGELKRIADMRDIRADLKTRAAERLVAIPDIAMPVVRRLVDSGAKGREKSEGRLYARLVNGERGGYLGYAMWRRYLKLAHGYTAGVSHCRPWPYNL